MYLKQIFRKCRHDTHDSETSRIILTLKERETLLVLNIIYSTSGDIQQWILVHGSYRKNADQSFKPLHINKGSNGHKT